MSVPTPNSRSSGTIAAAPSADVPAPSPTPTLRQRWFAVPEQLDDTESGSWTSASAAARSTRADDRRRPATRFRSRFHDIVDGRADRLRLRHAPRRTPGLGLADDRRAAPRRRRRHPPGLHRAGRFFDGLDDPAEREHGTGMLLDAARALPRLGGPAMTPDPAQHPFASYCWKPLIALYERDVPFERADRSTRRTAPSWRGCGRRPRSRSW